MNGDYIIMNLNEQKHRAKWLTEHKQLVKHRRSLAVLGTAQECYYDENDGDWKVVIDFGGRGEKYCATYSVKALLSAELGTLDTESYKPSYHKVRFTETEVCNAITRCLLSEDFKVSNHCVEFVSYDRSTPIPNFTFNII